MILTIITAFAFATAIALFSESKSVRPIVQPKIILPQPQPKKKNYRVVRAKLTAYCPCKICCGKHANNRTSTNRKADKTFGVAVDPEMIKYRSMIEIPGINKLLMADDTGGAMRKAGRKGKYHIDIRFHDHQKAREFGVRENIEVKIYEPSPVKY